jgi:hypothetical protein
MGCDPTRISPIRNSLGGVMHALVVVAVTAGVILASLAGLLSVWSELFTRTESPVPAQPDDEEPYGDTSTIPGFADESDSVLDA